MSERLTSEQLDQLDAALEAMTPPPWETHTKYPSASCVCLFAGESHYVGLLGNSDDTQEQTEANAHGIVSALNHARALVAAARENERLRDAAQAVHAVLKSETALSPRWEALRERLRAALGDQ